MKPRRWRVFTWTRSQPGLESLVREISPAWFVFRARIGGRIRFSVPNVYIWWLMKNRDIKRAKARTRKLGQIAGDHRRNHPPAKLLGDAARGTECAAGLVREFKKLQGQFDAFLSEIPSAGKVSERTRLMFSLSETVQKALALTRAAQREIARDSVLRGAPI
jgi:hypothetical protein